MTELGSIIKSQLDRRDPENALLLAQVNFAECDDSSNAFLLACALYQCRDLHGALQALDRCSDPACVGEALSLGLRCAQELGDVPLVRHLAEKLLATENNDSNALCALGSIALQQGDASSAMPYFRDALQVNPLCSLAFEKLVEHYLLPLSDLLSLVNGLNLPPRLEAIRSTYKAKLGFSVPAAGVPAELRVLTQAAVEQKKNNLRRALQLIEALHHQQHVLSRHSLALYCTVLVDMKSTSKLFALGQEISTLRPRSTLQLYVIGCYYYSLVSYEKAGRYFSKVVVVEPSFAEAWVALGHCAAKLEEGEKALAAYRAGAQLFPCLHVLHTYMGMQYARVHASQLALSCLDEARRLSPNDPLSLNEIGVLYYKLGKYEKAVRFLSAAAKSLPSGETSVYLDCIHYNLGIAHRKTKNFDSALSFLQLYLQNRPTSKSGHVALAFTLQVIGNLKSAIHHYHVALSIKPDPLSKELLDRALQEEYGRFAVPGHSLGRDASDVSFATAQRFSESLPTDSPHPVGRALAF